MSDEFANWLKELGLGRYVEVFVENDVDLHTIPELTEDDLKELGLSLGHRRSLQKAVKSLSRNGHDSSELPVKSSPPPDSDASLAAWERHPGERKPVTMLFADITGSTALTETLDAEETHDLLYGATQRMCAAVENNQGTVCRFMGDGVMAMFGAPVASERHAVEACEAALEMQQAIRDCEGKGSGLQIRVGLHSGEVVVLTVGEGDKVEYDASGPTVPIAARMEQSAQPGEVYLTAATQSLAAQRIETEALAPLSVKGISAPVPVFSLRRVRSAEEAAPNATRTRFVGRRAELTQFRGSLDTCIAEGHGQTIYVRGEPGIGKTRLVEEFAAIAAENDVSTHRGLVLPFGVGKGQDAIRSLARSLLGITPGGGKDERVLAARTALSDGRLEPDKAVFLNDLLDLPQSMDQTSLYDAMENTTRNEGKRAVVSALVTAASNNQPAVVIVEDVHWANALTLAHLSTLTKTVANCPTLLVMTSRIEGDQLGQSWRSTTGGSPFVSIDLGPLRKQESITLIGEFINTSDELAKSCLERAAGNPLFLEQLLRNAKEGTGESLPDSIQSLVLARMDRLEAEDKNAIQAASALGQRFDVDALRDLLGREDYDCGELVEHSLVRPEGAGYLFAHALIQEGVYGSLLKRQRRALHQKAAEWFAASDPVLHAQHLDRAGDDRAPLAYLVAAQSQSSQYRAQQALHLVERGLDLAATTVQEFELNRFQGELLQHLGRVPDSMEPYRRCLQIAEDNIQRCRARIGLAAAMRVTDEFDEALGTLELAEAEAIAEGLKPELARIHHLRGNLYFPLGNNNGVVEQHKKALTYAREAGSPELEALALGGVGDGLYAQGCLLSAHEYFAQCIDVSRRHGLARIEAAHLIMTATTHHYLNELPVALQTSHSAVEAARKVGHTRSELMGHMCVAFYSFHLGDFAAVQKHVELGHSLNRELGAERFIPRWLQMQAKVAVVRGQSSDVVRMLKEAVAITRKTGIGYCGASILGTLALATEDKGEREEALTGGEEILRAGCVGHNYFEFYIDGMDACLNTGEWERVERYAQALEDYTRAEPLPWTDFFIARGRALASFGRGKRDDVTLQELQRLRDEAVRVGLKVAITDLDEALSLA